MNCLKPLTPVFLNFLILKLLTICSDEPLEPLTPDVPAPPLLVPLGTT
jgi:hypothetical protein